MLAIGARISSISSIDQPDISWRRRRNSSSGRSSTASLVLANRLSICLALLVHLAQFWRPASSFFSSSSYTTRPSARLTPIISPGPNRPRSIIRASSICTIPVSEPATINPSSVRVYRMGRRPFLSIPPITQSPEKAAIAAGPSHGSITELQ